MSNNVMKEAVETEQVGPFTRKVRGGGTKTRQAVMAYLMAMPGCTQKQISTHLDLNTGVVSTVIRDLMKLGVVKVSHDDANGRRKHGAQFYFFNQAMPDSPSHPMLGRRVSPGYLRTEEAQPDIVPKEKKKTKRKYTKSGKYTKAVSAKEAKRLASCAKGGLKAAANKRKKQAEQEKAQSGSLKNRLKRLFT